MSFNLKNDGNAKLALIMVAALFLVWLVQPTISEWFGKDNHAASVPQAQDKLAPTGSAQSPMTTVPTVPTVPALIPGADPFKAHIEKNGLAPSSNNSASANAVSNNAPHQAGADPFKAFLEKQKQDSKAAGISPFGK